MCKYLEEQISKNLKLYEDIFNTVQKKLTKKLAHFSSTDAKNNFLQYTVLPNLKQRYKQILLSKQKYKCINCGVCCNFAVSEFSPCELQVKADSGDVYAKQFISTFTLYDNNKAKEIYPEYVTMLKHKSVLNKIYFYRCNKVVERGGKYFCPDYELRPDICKDFPNNPLVHMSVKCGYQDWKDDFEVETMYIKASVEIVSFLRKSEFCNKNVQA